VGRGKGCSWPLQGQETSSKAGGRPGPTALSDSIFGAQPKRRAAEVAYFLRQPKGAVGKKLGITLDRSIKAQMERRPKQAGPANIAMILLGERKGTGPANRVIFLLRKYAGTDMKTGKWNPGKETRKQLSEDHKESGGAMTGTGRETKKKNLLVRPAEQRRCGTVPLPSTGWG